MGASAPWMLHRLQDMVDHEADPPGEGGAADAHDRAQYTFDLMLGQHGEDEFRELSAACAQDVRLCQAYFRLLEDRFAGRTEYVADDMSCARAVSFRVTRMDRMGSHMALSNAECRALDALLQPGFLGEVYSARLVLPVLHGSGLVPPEHLLEAAFASMSGDYEEDQLRVRRIARPGEFHVVATLNMCMQREHLDANPQICGPGDFDAVCSNWLERLRGVPWDLTATCGGPGDFLGSGSLPGEVVRLALGEPTAKALLRTYRVRETLAKATLHCIRLPDQLRRGYHQIDLALHSAANPEEPEEMRLALTQTPALAIGFLAQNLRKFVPEVELVHTSSSGRRITPSRPRKPHEGPGENDRYDRPESKG